MKTRLVAIHQPNFFPWLGFFHKVVTADLFVFLDHVQFPKKGGTWINRVKVVINQADKWLTVPVVRQYHGYKAINEMLIDMDTPWKEKMLKTIEINYRRCPHFDSVFPVVRDLILVPIPTLSDYNQHIILTLLNRLEQPTDHLVKGSSLPSEGNATDLLISIVKAAGGTGYMCGGGAQQYQEDEKFALSGLQLVYQQFQHPEYPQANTTTFIKGLSIIDVLMNLGFDGTKSLMENWRIAKHAER